jgi:hypothetical protein
MLLMEPPGNNCSHPFHEQSKSAIAFISRKGLTLYMTPCFIHSRYAEVSCGGGMQAILHDWYGFVGNGAPAWIPAASLPESKMIVFLLNVIFLIAFFISDHFKGEDFFYRLTDKSRPGTGNTCILAGKQARDARLRGRCHTGIYFLFSYFAQ